MTDFFGQKFNVPFVVTKKNPSICVAMVILFLFLPQRPPACDVHGSSGQIDARPAQVRGLLPLVEPDPLGKLKDAEISVVGQGARKRNLERALVDKILEPGVPNGPMPTRNLGKD